LADAWRADRSALPGNPPDIHMTGSLLEGLPRPKRRNHLAS
jgi:hypothetical protein